MLTVLKASHGYVDKPVGGEVSILVMSPITDGPACTLVLGTLIYMCDCGMYNFCMHWLIIIIHNISITHAIVFAGLKLKQEDPVPWWWQFWRRRQKSKHSDKVQQPISLTDISD